ncbi:hypothetical protein AAIH25_15010 [Arthrobacter crystallopoietes]|uniref:hypothetical protein n=1 Tax=Crystallibacter crystallopoietes TaxID=37928 RepID=UPI003D22B2A1
MDVATTAALIIARHGDRLEKLRRTFLAPKNIVSELNPYGRHRLAGLGPLPSVSDRHADVTVGAELADLAYAHDDLTLEGYKITLSLAAHDRILGGRITLDIDETDAWLYAVLGQTLADRAYHAGALSGTEPHRLTTVFYYVYLDLHRQPVPRPETADDSFEVPVRPEAFA